MMLRQNDFATHRSAVFCADAGLNQFGFCAWISQAAPGDRLEYHRGFLGIDITAVISTLLEAERRQLGALTRTAYRSCEAGLVDLVQVRIGPDDFAYVAVVRTRPEDTPIPLDSLLADQEAV